MDPTARRPLSRVQDILATVLLTAIGLGIVFVLITVGLYVHEGTRQLRRSDIKHDAMLDNHTKALKDHETANREHDSTFARHLQAFDTMLDNHRRIMHALER